MAKCRVQARISTTGEPCVSVIAIPITGSSTAHIISGVNLHYGGLLGDNVTLRTPYK